MLLIPCPSCGPRAESEFRCGGESPVVRPAEPENASDDEWADYLFNRTNVRGGGTERWHHRFGCGRWFNLTRDTVTHDIMSSFGMAEQPPAGERA